MAFNFTPINQRSNTQVPGIGFKPVANNNMAGGTPPSVKNPQQVSPAKSNVGVAGQGYYTNTGWVSGTPDQNYLNQSGSTLESLGFSKYNPTAVDVKIGNTTPADALNSTPSPTTLSERNKGSAAKVLDTRFGQEEEALLKQISNMKMGVANLSGTQAKEYANLETNPEGVFGSGVLNSQLNRLSKDQAIELGARTGQLNAMLDTLELYQGYRPQMVGTPQIDETTGEAFAYIQDPMTGEITTQSMGVIATPNPYANAVSLSEGQTLIDPATGEVIKSIPKTYAPKDGGLSGGTGGKYGGTIDWEDPSTIDSLPVSTLTKAVMSGTGTMKDLTPTVKAKVLEEMYNVGYSPNQVLAPKLQQLEELWTAIPNSHKGLIQGLNPLSSKINDEAAAFESAKVLLTRQIARLYDVGVLSDMDVANYKAAMPSRTDSKLSVVQAKLRGITSASTGKSTTEQYQEGARAEMDDGRIATYKGGKWVDEYTGQVIKID